MTEQHSTSSMLGKVALVTGAGRGQGRSHAVRLAERGCDIIALDTPADEPTIEYGLATAEDLAETARQITDLGRRVVTARVDVRDHAGMVAAVAHGVEELGHLNIAVANAGVCSTQNWDEVTPERWDAIVGINLTGTWNTCAAALPHLLAAGGGSLILIASTAALKGQPFITPYAAAKHGVVGIMRSLANELGSQNIRVNTVHPTGVDTPMLQGMTGLGKRINANPELGPLFLNALPPTLIQANDVSDTVVFLASDEAKYITGLTMTIDAGASNR